MSTNNKEKILRHRRRKISQKIKLGVAGFSFPSVLWERNGMHLKIRLLCFFERTKIFRQPIILFLKRVDVGSGFLRTQNPMRVPVPGNPEPYERSRSREPGIL